jgi:hypothetical protein
MNHHCTCPEPGFCERHKMMKTQREWELCRGTASNSPTCGKTYWLAWERGQIGATAPPDPVLDPEGFCDRAKGLGDTVAKAIKVATAGIVQPCGGCKQRAATLNHWVPAASAPVERLDLSEPLIRNCTFHVWPVKKAGAWRWNCDQLMRRADLFNGKRIVAIVHDSQSEHPDAVKEYMRDWTDDFIVLGNNPKLREVVTFVPMLERLESLDANELTFCCHSKAVKHRVNPTEPGTTLFRWAAAMFETCLDDWDHVRQLLQDNAMAGSFRRFGQFKTHRNNAWHYSGTFYWFRHVDVFQRNWRYLDQKFFGTESWPGHMFKADETACIFADKVDDLYQLPYWNSVIQPQLDEWRQRHAVSSLWG